MDHTLNGETKIRVRYAETDRMGIVYHSNHIVWFEVGRTELFRQIGLPYTLFEKEGIGLAVIEVSCRYRKPAYYDDEITVFTEVEKFTSRRVLFNYKILKGKTLIAEGKTLHFFVNHEGRPVDVKDYLIWEQTEKILSKYSLI